MRRSTLLTVVQVGVAVAMSLAVDFVPLGTSAPLIWACLGVFYWCAARAIVSPVSFELRRPSYLTGEILFLLFAYILLFFPYQLAVLGATDLWFSRFVEFAFVEYTNPSLVASTSGVLAFSAGVRLRPWSANVQGNAVVESQRYVDAFLMLVAPLQIASIGVLILSGGLAEVAAGAYGGSITNDRTQDGLYFLSTFFAMLGVAGGLYRRWRFRRLSIPVVTCLVLAAAWASMLLLLGDRNSFLLLAVVALGGCSVFFFRIGPVTIGLSLTLALFGYNVIEESRQSATRDFASLVSAMNSREDRDFAESSFTNTTVTSRAAFALVPQSYPYFYGKFKVIGIAGVVPFSRGLFVSPNDTFVTSADVISAGVLGSRATWSLGTNVISDIYVDFGAVGIPILMFGVGLFLSFVTGRFLQVRSLKWSIAYVMSVALLAELPRYSFDFPVRPLVWTFLMLALFRVAWRFMVTTSAENKKDALT